MLIRLNKRYVGPLGVHEPGAEIELPAAQAKQWLNFGLADAVKAVKQIERADTKPDAETATIKKKARSRKGAARKPKRKG
jgi:hypothetical protein